MELGSNAAGNLRYKRPIIFGLAKGTIAGIVNDEWHFYPSYELLSCLTNLANHIGKDVEVVVKSFDWFLTYDARVRDPVIKVLGYDIIDGTYYSIRYEVIGDMR